MKLDSVEKVLDFAIQKEQDASEFYAEMAEKLDKQYMKDIFSQFSLEEQSHKAKLIEVKAGNLELSEPQKILDLKIAEGLTDEVVDAKDVDFQQALIIAMKAEKASYKLYNDLADMTDDANIKNIFLGLAQEEAKHKLRFEIEYDDEVYKEN